MKNNVITFYRPLLKKVKAEPEPVLERMPAKQLLKEINTKDVEVILILTRDKDGSLGFIGNTMGAEEAVFVMNQVLHKTLHMVEENWGDKDGPRKA